MHAILTVFLKEFHENLRERRTLFTALILGPLLMPLLFAGGLAFSLKRGAAATELPVTLAVSHGERARWNQQEHHSGSIGKKVTSLHLLKLL